VDITSEVDSEQGTVVVDKETARASYVQQHSWLFLADTKAHTNTRARTHTHRLIQAKQIVAAVKNIVGIVSYFLSVVIVVLLFSCAFLPFQIYCSSRSDKRCDSCVIQFTRHRWRLFLFWNRSVHNLYC